MVITLSLELTEDEAWDLAQFVKRVGWNEIAVNAEDEGEAYRMRDVLVKLQRALAADGVAPR